MRFQTGFHSETSLDFGASQILYWLALCVFSLKHTTTAQDFLHTLQQVEVKHATFNTPSGKEFCLASAYGLPKVFPSAVQCKEDVVNLAATRHPLDEKTTPEILEHFGYESEEYKVTTKDGYILTIFRIVSPEEYKGRKRTPVYLNHGMIASSDFWFFQHPAERCLPIALVNQGFDVWLPNCRGSTYSQEHETMNPKSDIKYWDFTFHELGHYDMPAVTNLILKTTGYNKLLYIGYSMGTTQAFIGLSEIPSLNKKIQSAHMIAPTAHQGHTVNTMRYVSRVMHSYEAYSLLNERFGGRIKNSKEMRDMLGVGSGEACAPTSMQCGVCDNLWFQIYGYNPFQMNRNELPNILKRFPNTASIKTFSHYAQHMNSCKFGKYSYTKAMNMEKYGTPDAPDYPLENIKTHIYFYVAPADNFGSPMDANKTAKHLSPGVLKGYHLVPDELFNHLDFAIAKDVDKLAFDQMIMDMKKERKLIQRDMEKKRRKRRK